MSIVRVSLSTIALAGLGMLARSSLAQTSPGHEQEQTTKDEPTGRPAAGLGKASVDHAEPSSPANQAVVAPGSGPREIPQPAPPPPPTPAQVPGKPEAGALSPLGHPPFSIERETTASRFERSAGISALVLYSGQWGLVAGGSARLLGFFDLAVGYEITPAGKSAMMLGGGLFVFNLNGFDLSLWSMFGGPLVKAEPTAEHPASENRTTVSFESFVVRFGIPLYARWLPLRIPSTRVILTYNLQDYGPVKPASFREKLGVGLEMGLL